MRNITRKKVFFICFVLFFGLGGILIWGVFQTGKTNGLNINIPEIKADEIIKNIYLKNNYVAGESLLITYNKENLDKTYYSILRFPNKKPLNELTYDLPFNNRFSIYTQGFSNFTIYDYPKTIEKIDFKYHYTNTPVFQEKLSDTVLIQNFSNTNLEMSLTHERKRDIGFEIKKPATIILYNNNDYLYFIYVIKLYDKEKKWVTISELKNNLFPIIKNWGIYDK